MAAADFQDADTTTLVSQVHRSGRQLVIAVNGGSLAVSALLTVPGASRSILLATVPYAAQALTEWIGFEPEQFCSSRTARTMAMAAYERARKLLGKQDTPASTVGGPIGVACTVSLASDRPKRGAHRFFVATQSADTTSCIAVELEKGRRTRYAEECLAAQVILNEIAERCGVAERVATDFTPQEIVQRRVKVASEPWQGLLAGNVACVAAGREDLAPRVLLPGAFHPLHEGHLGMAATAERILQVPVSFELSVLNVDKPPLDFLEIEERLQQFRADQSVWLTRAPTFFEKARIFPGVVFVVGVDTLERIALPRYYGESVTAMRQAIDGIAAAGCRFLVFGRQSKGVYRGLKDLKLPPALERLCGEVPESEFRMDVSSTEIRRSEIAKEP